MRKLLPHVLSRDKVARVPVNLIHFLTSRCNARCPHCFIFGENDARFTRDELTVDEIERMARDLGKTLYNVSLTGGEIFVRKDVVEIAEAYLRHSGVETLQIFTNGWFEDAVVEAMDRLSRDWPDRQIIMATSIDDLEERHNEYRKLKDGFARALRTYERVRDLARPNIGLDIGLTVSLANQDRLDAIYDFLVRERGYRTLSCTLVLGEPLDPAQKEVDLGRYEAFSRRIAEGVRRGELDCFEGFAGADLLNAKSAVMRAEIPRIIHGGYQSPCYAGRLIAVVYSNGDVYPCELLPEKRIGNVRDFDFSMERLWASPRAREVRDWIWATKCHCTHECFATMNILFNPVYYPKLLKEYARIKLGFSR